MKYNKIWLCLAVIAAVIDIGLLCLLLFGITYLYAPIEYEIPWRMAQFVIGFVLTFFVGGVAAEGLHIRKN